jgi:hypothetical protein
MDHVVVPSSKLSASYYLDNLSLRASVVPVYYVQEAITECFKQIINLVRVIDWTTLEVQVAPDMEADALKVSVSVMAE